MAKSKSTRARSDLSRANPAPDDSGAPDPEATATRIVAYLGNMRPMPDCVWEPAITLQQSRAVGLLGQLALSATESGPATLKLKPRDCADILTWMSTHVPLEGNGWWESDAEISHVCGFNAVLDAMAASLRGGAQS